VLTVYVNKIMVFSNLNLVYKILAALGEKAKYKNMRIANESFEKVAKFEYLGMTLTNQDDIRDEIKSILNSGNACYYSVQNLQKT
jgi:hypothetical protein